MTLAHAILRTRALLVLSAVQFYWLCENHMWMAPACEGVKFCSGDLVGCGQMI
jgi:hypothetical protein